MSGLPDHDGSQRANLSGPPIRKPWTIEWRLLPGVELRKGCLTCVYPEKDWTVFRRYKSEKDRDTVWDGFQSKKSKWASTYEIRRGFNGNQ